MLATRCARILFALAAACHLVGCAAKTVSFDGSRPRPAGEVATIRSNGDYSEVTHIDGKTVHGNTKMQVTPGRHTVGIRYVSGGAGPQPGLTITATPRSHDIQFEAEQGQEYELGYPTIWFGRKPYVKNVKTGRNLSDFQIDGGAE